jgi:hypoxanthine phosphoribosyltransferase
VVLEPLLDTDAVIGKRLLVVDDVADSGRTLELVLGLLRRHTPQVRSAVLYTKPRTIVRPDYSWQETDLWINFPWSSQPVITAA